MLTSPSRLAIATGVTLLIAGALYLLATRGSALLVDLAAAAWACF